jgi:superfamily II DNA or RNA helicase
MLDLRDYQEEAIVNIGEAEDRGVRRPLVVHPTGSGKTVTFCHLLKNRPGRGCVLVHRDELAGQAVDKLQVIAPELSVGVVKAERNEVDNRVVVASVQTVQNTGRLAELLGHGEFATVVVDEAHHAPAPSWQGVLQGLGSFAPDGPLTCGFTATPERKDTALGVWQEVVAYRTIREMILAGYLAPIEGQRVDTAADFSQIRKSDGDLQAGQLGDELLRSGAIGEIGAAILKYAPERKTVAFLPTVATAQALAADLAANGIAAEAVWGAMPVDERRAVLRRLHTGETRVVTNCSVLTEGFDEASIDCIVIARPTASHGLYVQMIGRGTRRYPGKENCLILDVVGATERHDLVSVIDLGVSDTATGTPGTTGPGVPAANPCALCGLQLSPALLAAGETRHPNCRVSGGTAKTTDLFAQSWLRWLPVDGGFALPTDKGALVIAPKRGVDDLWQLIDYAGSKLTVLNSSVPVDWAMGVGEDRARAFGRLAERSASWLRRRPTPQQLSRLEREGFPPSSIKKITTRGQAADLITRLQGRRALRRLERSG